VAPHCPAQIEYDSGQARALTARSRCQILCQLQRRMQMLHSRLPVFLHSCLLPLPPALLHSWSLPHEAHSLPRCPPPTAHCPLPKPKPKPRPPRYFSLCLLTLRFTCSRQGRRTVVVCSYFHILAGPLSGRSLARCCDF
jgi:hypothetical protein